MFNYDYVAAHKNGNLSDFLLSKAQVYDRDGVEGLNKIEYSQFQQWFEQKDIETYGLDVIKVSKAEKREYYDEKLVPEHIKNSDAVTEKQKETLKTLNKTREITLFGALIGGTLGSLGSMAGKPTILTGIGFRAGVAGLGIVGVLSLVNLIYKKSLEKQIANAEN